ncbi:MAG: hypothetical protein A2Y62_16120 [Candidatus Fischerbacteria bacterium RBG_13_37_8]|uniref:Uncharacterized protein n=1 Tax=Candidatus Fischerbacteria bacterium RBG_13_37_8 TaxID=1817863 RepID=A0A1F5VXP4_9BACT|nr:MAG: hypothetical protein A2Y62_16120 [Candidatus Fischerbacteria bacterium RBG_13_37_8]
MKIGKLPDQVIRLLIIFAILIAGFVIARIFFVPASFGKLGHYRADAITAIEKLPVKYAGSLVCTECHSDIYELKSKSYHKGLHCEVCHGAASKHANAPDESKPLIPRKRDHCAKCHSYLPSRPTGFPQINVLYHNPNKPCHDCHNPHDPTPPTIPSKCSACHANITRTISLSYHASLECKTCHETPPEHIENPSLNLPHKPAERSFCGNCHDPKAQSAKNIPRVDLETHYPGYLCWQCHYPHFPEAE